MPLCLFKKELYKVINFRFELILNTIYHNKIIIWLLYIYWKNNQITPLDNNRPKSNINKLIILISKLFQNKDVKVFYSLYIYAFSNYL